MATRAQLRELIESLEARYDLLPDDAKTDDGDSILRWYVAKTPDALSLRCHWCSLRVSIRTCSTDLNVVTDALESRNALLSPLRQLVAALTAECDDIRLVKHRIENFQRPVVTLPPELLCFVFELACLRNGQFYDQSGLLCDRMTRSAINMTCCRWREIALRSPSLWGEITIKRSRPPYLEGQGTASMVPAIALVRLEVERAARCPVSIRMALRDEIPEWDALQDLIQGALARCTLFSIRGPTMGLNTGLVLFSLPSLLSYLDTLSLDWSLAETSPRPANQDVVDLSQALALRTLWVVYSAPSIEFWGGSITKVIIKPPSTCCISQLCLFGFIDPVSAVGLINSCPKLETLLWSNFWDVLTPAAPPLTPKHMLRNLSILGVPPTFYAMGLEAPNLERLRIDPDYLRSRPLLYGFLAPPRFPRLRHIEVLSDMPHTTVTHFIRAHVYLESIVLAFWPDVALFEAMAARNTSSLPHLRKVTLSFEDLSSEAVVLAVSPLLLARA